MKLLRALAAATASVALVLGAGTVAASAAPAPQPLTLLTPTSGGKVGSPVVTFTWQAPAGQTEATVRVARTATTRNGVLQPTRRNAVDEADVTGAAGRYTLKDYDYPPDTYYWQVEATDAAGVEYRSAVRRFVVPVFFQLSKVKAEAITESYNRKRAVQVSAVMRCNYAQDQYYTQFAMAVLVGKKVIGRSSVAQGDCVGMYPTRTKVIFEPGSLKRGTKLTLQVYGESTHDSTVRWGGSSIKKAKGPKTTLRFTWRG